MAGWRRGRRRPRGAGESGRNFLASVPPRARARPRGPAGAGTRGGWVGSGARAPARPTPGRGGRDRAVLGARGAHSPSSKLSRDLSRKLSERGGGRLSAFPEGQSGEGEGRSPRRGGAGEGGSAGKGVQKNTVTSFRSQQPGQPSAPPAARNPDPPRLPAPASEPGNRQEQPRQPEGLFLPRNRRSCFDSSLIH